VAEPPKGDLEWLLMLTFPNGGSTALAKLLLSAPGTIALNPRIEGQWLDSAMSAPGARWDPATPLDYNAIRDRWIEAANQAAADVSLHDNTPLVVEKSPPNMCRYRAILGMLAGMKTHVVVLTRDPFATCASWHVRVDAERIASNWGWVGEPPTDDASYFRALGRIWLRRARYLQLARPEAIHWMRYEDVADHPAEALAALGTRIPRLAAADEGALLAVKDYPLQPLRNMNRDQLAILMPPQIDAIASALAEAPALMAQFGYAMRPTTS
jgi:hypothetical protein